MKKIIGNRIRKLRESKDLTQENMAAELDITAGAYAKIERGETDPSITRLIQIADILKVDVTYFVKDLSASQPPSLSMMVAEPDNRYNGYASKQDVENLAHLVLQLQRQVEMLFQQINSRPSQN